MAYDPTYEIQHFGRWRTERVLELARQEEDRIHGTLLLALASRETNLRNIVGGGYFKDGKWVSTGQDRGLYQFSEVYHEAWLKSVKGCLSGEYAEGFTVAQGGAFPRGRVPGLTSGTLRAIEVLNGNFRQAKMAGVPEEDIVKTALAGYNGGVQRAIEAYKRGDDPDSVTTGRNYGADVLARQHIIRKLLAKKGWP